MGCDGWFVLGWFKEYGGQGCLVMDQLIFIDEVVIVGVLVLFLIINSVVLMIMVYGIDEQKRFFLFWIVVGDLYFLIGYFEFGVGIDLVNLCIIVVCDGDDYVVNGQKMWISLIQYVDYVWLVVCINLEFFGVKKYCGILVLIVLMIVEGFFWILVYIMVGLDISVIYYFDVWVLVVNWVGEENVGWKLVINQFNYEWVVLVLLVLIFGCLCEVCEWV